MQKVTIYSDGACKGNPNGPGGYGAIIQFVDNKGKLHEKEISKGFKDTTNNRMELSAVIDALKELTVSCDVDLYTDSNYVVKAFNEGWVDNWLKTNFRIGKKDEVKNIDLWEELIKLTREHKVKFHWVKGHAGHKENERCDKLASDAAKQESN